MDEKQRAILDEIPRLRRYARSLLRDRDSADDLVQDCLERALLRLDNWQTGESPRKWLFTIMHHLFIDQMRKVNRRGEASMLPLEAGGGPPQTPPPQEKRAPPGENNPQPADTPAPPAAR
ncbi:RNA polymerase sigma factor, partial [Mesorhizobium sp. M1252]|uniref:RNA polymerase sigma factor n=1 Tax=Mesorhizobium sp. M1252 TaxID=2957073 RepID=UPI00333BDD4E